MTEKLSTFILSLMSEYFKLTEARIELEVVCNLIFKFIYLFICLRRFLYMGSMKLMWTCGQLTTTQVENHCEISKIRKRYRLLELSLYSFERNISGTRDRFSPHFQTQKRELKIQRHGTTRSGEFLMNLEMFRNVAKHCLEC